MAQWRANAIYEQFILEQNNNTFCKLEGVKNDEFRNVDWIFERLGNWNNTRTNSFLEMGKSSSNVQNVFKGSSLRGQRVHRY